MSMQLDGKSLADEIRQSTARQINALKADGIEPTLAILTATDDPQSAWYVRSIVKAAEKVGLSTRLVELPPTADEIAVAADLSELASDSAVHGIILQTPLPPSIKADNLIGLIPFEKDVDGVNPLSAGRLASGLPAFAPATAAAVMKILAHYNVNLRGKRAVVVGRSRVVGKPVAQLLLNNDATVTICHSKTANLADITRQSEVLIVAVGQPNMITADYVTPETIVVDVGTNVRDDNMLVGDVDAISVEPIVQAITPVPGGVGPVTTALILEHTVLAAQKHFQD
jgi:methylenetetrahydrofolate dehydrogenase (NADP+)/methenyltetrahydrofolate cyclohydrolase